MSDTLSVVMPVYNAKRYVAQAVESVLAQTYRDFSFNIVDDGSTDSTLGILHSYARRDPRISIISRPNTGIVGALNDGLRATQSTYIARMDADDISLPQRFEKQMAFMQSHPEVVAVGSRVKVIDPFDQELFDSDHQLDHDWIDSKILEGRGWSLVHPATILRRSAVEQVGLYRQEYNFLEDVDLFLRLAEIGRLSNLPDVLLKYRQHPGSVTKSRADLQRQLYERAIRETYQRRGKSLPPDWKYEPRPTPPAIKMHRDWGWRALNSGLTSVARQHAYASMKLEPFSPQSWKLLLCAWRGH